MFSWVRKKVVPKCDVQIISAICVHCDEKLMRITGLEQIILISTSKSFMIHNLNFSINFFSKCLFLEQLRTVRYKWDLNIGCDKIGIRRTREIVPTCSHSGWANARCDQTWEQRVEKTWQTGIYTTDFSVLFISTLLKNIIYMGCLLVSSCLLNLL